MANFNGGKSDGSGTLPGNLDDACFAFGCGCHYVLNGISHYVDWCISFLVAFFLIISKHKPDCGLAAVFGGDQVGGISLRNEEHVTSWYWMMPLGYVDR